MAHQVSLIELEAADYFELEPSQVRMLADTSGDWPIAQEEIAKMVGKTATRRLDGRRDQQRRHLRRKQTTVSKTGQVATQGRSGKTTPEISRPKGSMSRVEAAGCSVLLADSSTASTNSLPSISSSPSVSPSLVCPHLSLDDILGQRTDSRSPHTIGLCARCRLNPPPDIHSPLSPAFKPSAGSSPRTGGLRRGNSDHQAIVSRRRVAAAPAGGNRRLAGASSGLDLRDDSLDYYLEPRELRRLEMSPSLRHSVEFIRNNSIEAGRVLLIHKNGQPFDKPLRVCITRGEFSSLNHLLDHINSRQLIPSGARYLFHLDGQLVYSVNELKHQSIYIVSGSRCFDAKAAGAIKEEQRRRQQVALASSRKLEARIHFDRRPSQVPSEPASVKQAPAPEQVGSTNRVEGAQSRAKAQRQRTTGRPHTVAELADRSRRKVGGKSPRLDDDTVSRSNEQLAGQVEEQPVERRTVVRAKSELSALPNKRKKNVTFEDTGRGSSPAIAKVEPAGDQALQTSEIGIQVSDSIEGFLIDLPLAIPRKPADEREERPRVKAARSRVAAKSAASPRRQQVGRQPAKRQIVTISERQLSLEEMDQLRDMDHGDHHSELHKIQHVTIRLDAATESSDQADETTAAGEREQVADAKQQEEAVRDDDPRWQSPGSEGERAGTPAERPVSQSEANESVHARVTTPTPSMSTAGETSSLSLEAQSVGEPAGRRRVAVCGRLCPNGLDPPTRNFRLVWVNGFAINERYPENSLQQQVGEQQQQAAAELLSPSSAAGRQSQASVQFKPNERFANWMAHSRTHDELLYPAGCLVVAWSRTTGEQRYYGAHTSNVSALALAPTDPDLVASAQEPDQSTGLGRASLHLWSLGSLETLQVVEDEQLLGRRVFSIQLEAGEQEGQLEVSVGAREERRLWLFAFRLKLAAKTPLVSSLRASKPLQANQVPLQVSRLAGRQPAGGRLADALLSFGRRHFQVWAPERRTRTLGQLKVEAKSGRLSETIAGANCLLRLAAGELVLGDTQGRLSLLRISLAAKTDSYSLELTDLRPADQSWPAITCLARVSSHLFVSGDSSCTLRFWRLQRDTGGLGCEQLRSLALPPDLGLPCALLLASYSKKRAHLELYIVSTGNAILFGSVALGDGEPASLQVVYEGHESSVMGLVADRAARSSKSQFGDYFTCSLDCKICKWNGKSLIWKSLLPSACASLAVHPLGFVLAVGAADGTVYVLDKVSGLLISYFPLTPVCINCLAYSRDGSLLAAGCANGTIFILPVYERGLRYKKVSIFQSPHPVMSLQFSLDNQYILTSVTNAAYQELILWDLPHFKYMRDNVELAADKIKWFDSICSGSEDVRAIWENANVPAAAAAAAKLARRPPGGDRMVNLSCHRLVYSSRRPAPEETPAETDFVVASDTRGYLRLFRYPCYDTQQAFYEARVSSSAMNCCRFLANRERRADAAAMFVSTSLDGSIYLWTLD